MLEIMSLCGVTIIYLDCEYIQMMVNKLEVNDVEKWAVTTWAIWNARNKYYFEQVQPHPRDIMRQANGFLQEYQRFM